MFNVLAFVHVELNDDDGTWSGFLSLLERSALNEDRFCRALIQQPRLIWMGLLRMWVSSGFDRRSQENISPQLKLMYQARAAAAAQLGMVPPRPPC